MQVDIVGLGEVGLKFAALAVAAGAVVVGTEKSTERRTLIREGLKPLGYEFEISGVVVTPEIATSDVYVVCVDTPLMDHRPRADLSNLLAAVEAVSHHIRPGNLVIIRSTVPIGTTRSRIAPLIARVSGLRQNEYYLAFAPERTTTCGSLDESRSINHLVGGINPESCGRAVEFMSSIGMHCISMQSLEAAELGKLATNAARDVGQALANQICSIAENYDIEVERLIEQVNSAYPRDSLKKPSPGVGGSCLTKDSYILAESLDPVEPEATILGIARAINDAAQDNTITSIQRHFEKATRPHSQLRVLVCGAAFKGDPPTKDTRNSVPLNAARRLVNLGFTVAVFDPEFSTEEIRKLGFSPMSVTSDLRWDSILLFSNNRYFQENERISLLASSLVPGGYVYDPHRWLGEAAGQLSPGTLYRTLSSENILR